ncbi:MAG: ABC transporter permease [Chloroflexi bacterium]|nr:ABC transporter permease [Chloroflexota bacterium]
MFSIIAILGATMIVFGLSRMGGDPRYFFAGQSGYGISQEQWDKLGEDMGLDKPVPIQYFIWLGEILKGDFGTSITTQAPVIDVIGQRVSATGKLALAAWVFGTAIGVPLGILSAVKRGSMVDYAIRIFALFGQGFPTFFLGIVLILIFSVHFRIFPVGTIGEGFSIKNYVLPAITLGWLPAASYLRLTRSAMLEVLDTEYVKLARAKGVSRTAVVWKHALRNALIVPLTLSAFVLVGFINGAVVAETVFSWPGLGRLAISTIQDNDFPVISVLVLFTSILYVGVVFILDLLYAAMDPRIRYT